MTPLRMAVGVALCAAAAVPSIGAQQNGAAPPLVASGRTRPVAPHTYVIDDQNVPQVPNVGIVVGERVVLVVDPGLGRRNGDTVAREVAALGGRRDVVLVSTHYHSEHTTGIGAFAAPARYVTSRVQAEEYVANIAGHAAGFTRLSPVHAELLREVPALQPAELYDREHRFDLGGVHVRAVVVGPTHTRGDTVFIVEEDGVVFAGDVVMNESFVAANQNSSMRAWLAAYDLLEPLRPRVVVPAHGPAGDGSLIATNRRFMLAIQARARELKAQGRPVDEVAATVQKEMQALHPTFARLNGVAGAARAAFAEAP